MTSLVTWPITDESTMLDVGRRLGSALVAGDAVCLTGPLGAGKTTLTRGLAAGLGIVGPVTSPTFVISRRYRGSGPDLVHCDAYRLAGDDDFADIVPDPDDVVVVIEWGRPVMAAVVDSWLDIDIDRGVGHAGESRTLTMRGVGAQWDDERMRRLVADS